MNNILFTAGIDGDITVTVNTPTGLTQNLTGCTVTLKIANECEDDAVFTKQMTVNVDKCTVHLTPVETDFIMRGRYEAQLIILDAGGKTRATERQLIIINKVIK